MVCILIRGHLENESTQKTMSIRKAKGPKMEDEQILMLMSKYKGITKFISKCNESSKRAFRALSNI